MIQVFVPRPQEVRAKRIAPLNEAGEIDGEVTVLARIDGAYIELSTAAFSAIFEPMNGCAAAPVEPTAAAKTAKPRDPDKPLPIKQLVLMALESGPKLTKEIVDFVLARRGDSTPGSIGATVNTLNKDGQINRADIPGTTSFKWYLAKVAA